MSMDTGSPMKSPERTKSPKKTMTRYGAVKQADLKFGTEERFRWQSAQDTSDVIYEIPELTASRSVLFGCSLRKGLDDENPDNKKRSTGPGSYNFAPCFDHHSEYAVKHAGRFSQAARQSMAMKTPSPGAVYNIEKQYWNGPVKDEGIGFANGERGELYGTSTAANADMFFPRPAVGPQISIAKRFKPKSLNAATPGAIYDVHKKRDFKTGPSFSFGHGRAKRFSVIAFLPEIIND
ncbi:hypothetical protein B484DRAFT_445615 [Ochromonadaceae sp. CCMP2298]|nr:hypothetical protein B484DRAFT_445615 [Ochromonadaceae sp. CCMP2298]|mmetsp:Transcript_11486/g.25494  ORF Transcript_11486/g.25494 Transcript_11486/m.25494 type:complete len:236 (-) Transcript_11486:141-848(-)|eukprot:CAMPEP_0173205834 /NCGR_PEP_ID=MMETSP1141-20130122/20982_1 /TAXON_ID=483371 /ORGANISM="non described non described, Strain CCMP2298" /LENGTH=235 /DNA_ID=CAMNT_0014131821 /DNA_START=127 /DNA_END=834 /DNA_ORIENTATION=+